MIPDVLTVPPNPHFPIGQKAAAFRAEFYPDASDADWSDWHWQMRSRLRGEEQIRRIFRLSDDELEALRRHRDSLPVAITPYYAALLDRENPDDPLRRTHLQVSAEYVRMPEEFDDPLAEDAYSPVPDLVHHYPDRVLFLVTGTCATWGIRWIASGTSGLSPVASPPATVGIWSSTLRMESGVSVGRPRFRRSWKPGIFLAGLNPTLSDLVFVARLPESIIRP